MKENKKFRSFVAKIGILFCGQMLAQGATFTVTKTTDGGAGTLRQAIMDANTNANVDTIVFNITGTGVKTINLSTALPQILKPVVIDGTTQPGYTGTTPLIEINATNAAAAYGLELLGGSNVIKALTINRCPFAGIVILTNGNNVIERCFIGTDSTGTNASGNGLTTQSDGITIINSSGNVIGGLSAGAGNVLSGNARYGVGVVGPLATNNWIQGNYIGTDRTGMAAIPNHDGIGIVDSPGNLIGGGLLQARNIISGNSEEGIELGGSSASRNLIQGNYIGLKVTGTNGLGNGGNGILVSTHQSVTGPASSTVIDRNFIGGNGRDGVQLGFGVTSNLLTGNIIGISSDGSISVPNLRHGVSIFDSTNNVVGGSSVFEVNYISGNRSNGVFIGRGGLSVASVSNIVKGNTIAFNGLDGVQISGGAIANQVVGNTIGKAIGFGGYINVGNFRHGVCIFDSTNNLIGWSGAQPGNYINGNRSNGVFIGIGPLATGSLSNNLVGNQVGVAEGNGLVGVFVHGNGNMIGGFGERDGNWIAHNGTNLLLRGHGIVIEAGTGNAILRNEIWDNSGRGIDLGKDSFTINDIGDEDTGANDLQNYPVVTGVNFKGPGGTHTITWTLNSKPSRPYYVEFFGNDNLDPSGFGEGRHRLSSTTVATDTNGVIVFTDIFGTDEKFISSTATDLQDMNTSEFSPVDTDGDGIADAWEIFGIDYNQDGTNDLVLVGANPMHKDIYVEIDAMEGRAPDMNNLNRVLTGTTDPVTGVSHRDGYNNVPNDLVHNPDGSNGVSLHLELDETNLPFATPWTNEVDSFVDFDRLKSNYFGTLDQFSNSNALLAKALIYRYCIFADHHSLGLGCTRGKIANDFFIVLGTNSSSATEGQVPTTFMHELGHSLGLDHGGIDGMNVKPNYHSVMNYVCRPNGPTFPWLLDYSREKFADLNETNLDEAIGIGASSNHMGHTVVVGPSYVGTNAILTGLRVPEFGPVDWNGNNTSNDTQVARNLDYFRSDRGAVGAQTNTLAASEDWSQLHYYFLDSPASVPGHLTPFTNDLPPTLLEDLEKVGTGVGMLQFSAANFSVSETSGVAIISVSRIFEAEANVSVSFSAFDGTATNGMDYVATNGVLNFSGPDTLKSFAIPILNDASPSGLKTVNLLLSNPGGGATLGPQRVATLTIIDDDPPGRFTVINTNDAGPGSLRQAITDATSATGLAIVDFNIPGTSGLTISLASVLPPLTHSMTIDGTTQPGFSGAPIIELNGASASGTTDGLWIMAGHCVIRGLVINRFSSSGIKLSGPGESRIEACYIGLNRQGTLKQGSSFYGINVDSPNNVIGGTTPGARNYICGNLLGILLGFGQPFGPAATNNQVLGNFIGLGVDGSIQGNPSDGIQVYASRDIIGGLEPGAGNIISGNGRGVTVQAGIETTIVGNYIGTDPTGMLARGNNGDGIILNGGAHVLGGNQPGAGNVISGNGAKGVTINGTNMVVLGNFIGTDGTGQNALSNQTGGVFVSGLYHQIGDTTDFGANTIAFNNGPGVQVSLGVNVTIRGNSIFSNNDRSSFIETLGIDLDPKGISLNDTKDIDTGANQLQNFPVLTTASNSIAGTIVNGTLNSTNSASFTIDIYANVSPDPSGYGEGQFWMGSTNVITDASGNASFTAQLPVIHLKGRHLTATATDASGNTSEFSPAIFAESSIPGRTFTVFNVNDSGEGSLRQAVLDANAYFSERDTIQFNIGGPGVHTIRPLTPLPPITDPVLIDGYTQPGSLPNTAPIGDNAVLLIELDGSLANATHGLEIQSGESVIRGLVINRFASGASPFDLPGGVMLIGRDNNRIEGNFIGTDPTGFLDRGNFFRGIVMRASSSNVIGGTLPASRNIISANHASGAVVSGEAVFLYGDSVNPPSGNLIQGNLIGTAADGITALGNSGCAIRWGQPITNTTIGGILPGAGNVIAFNASGDSSQDACGIDDPLNFGASGIAILGNTIYSNAGPGIKGDFVNSSDGRGNFPFLSSGISSNGITTIQGHLSSVSNALHRIEFFANETFDPSGYGEGKYFLGSTNVPTDSNGVVVFTAVLPVTVSNGMFLSATATDDRNNTSEFSPRLAVGDVLTNVIIVNSLNDADDGMANATHTSLREAIVAANNHTGPDTIRFAIGTGAKSIGIASNLPPIMDAGTTIDATTQPGFTGQPLIYLDGLLQSGVCFRLYSPSNTIRGFAMSEFYYGIYGDATYCSPYGGFNVIEGNYIGSDRTGAGAIGTMSRPITFLFPGCSSNRIGGASAAARNVISGNYYDLGIGIYCERSHGNTIAGNFIGVGPSGSNAVPNNYGVRLNYSLGTLIGGDVPAARNVIAGNVWQQVALAGCDGAVVQGNYIGTDVSGTTNISNNSFPLSVDSSVLIKSNVINGFATGVELAGSSNRVEGNFIGTDFTGTRKVAGFSAGVRINTSGFANIIGGTTAGSRNLIAGYDGIQIFGPSNIVQGNLIGTKPDGVTALTNNGIGIVVQSSFNQIGGTGPGAGNIIAFCTSNGVAIISGTNNAVLGNSIFSDIGLGIDLDVSGVSTNDPGDEDLGPNNLQNFPILSAARNIGVATLFQGTLSSASNTTFRIEFFANTNCHPSGFGPGRAFVNAFNATTDPSGNVTFSFNHPAPMPVGQFITATATDANNNTSEFSPCVAVINDTNYVVLASSTSSPYTLSWPVSASGFLLERSTNLSPPVIWQIISNGITTNSGLKVFTVTNPPSPPTLFFRLRRP